MSIDKILEYVKRTNPGMTKQKLIEEMAVCRYSANALIVTANTTPKKLDSQQSKWYYDCDVKN